MLTKEQMQSLLNKMTTAIAAQGVGAGRGYGSCEYWMEVEKDGLVIERRCGIGHLMDRDTAMAIAQDERRGWWVGALVDDVHPLMLDGIRVTGADKSFLGALQAAHDHAIGEGSADRSDFLPRFFEGVRRVATTYDLRVPPEAAIEVITAPVDATAAQDITV